MSIIFLSSLIFLLGLALGSFLNCFVYRTYTGKSIQGRSFCPHCKHFLGFFDLIPLLSFVLLKGRCRYCGKKISWQYPLVELFTAVVLLMGFYWYKPIDFFSNCCSSAQIISFLFFAVFTFILIFIFVYDFKYYLIPDKISLPSILVIFIIQILFYFLKLTDTTQFFGPYILSFVIAAVIGGAFFFLQFAVSRGRWIGGGDIRLGALMGAVLGWPYILIALFLSYILGSVVSVILIILKRKKMQSRVPFGTFLTIGTLIALLWGRQILGWYLKGW